MPLQTLCVPPISVANTTAPRPAWSMSPSPSIPACVQKNATTSRSKTTSAAASRTSRPTTSSMMPQTRSRTTSTTSSATARTNTPTSYTTSPLESPRDAFSADSRATSGLTAPTRAAPDTRVSKGRDLSPYHSHQLLHPHIHFFYHPPSAVARVPMPDVPLHLPVLDVSPLFPHAYLYDVFTCASFTQTLLVSDCTPSRDYPLYCFVSDTLFITEDAPHHLIISLQSCTLRVCPMSSILLTCFTLRVPHTIQPH